MKSSTLTGLAAVLFGCGLVALTAALYRDGAQFRAADVDRTRSAGRDRRLLVRCRAVKQRWQLGRVLINKTSRSSPTEDIRALCRHVR